MVDVLFPFSELIPKNSSGVQRGSVQATVEGVSFWIRACEHRVKCYKQQALNKRRNCVRIFQLQDVRC
jgi:hypothetical protein